MSDFDLTFETIAEGDRTITFAPPLKVSCYEDDDKAGTFELYFDYGMNCRLGTRSWFIKQELPLEDKLKIAIEFELFHAFFHYQEDPNYGLLNWALYGNLRDRATLTDPDL